MNQEIRDPQLWETAKKRATFKYHFLIYFIFNLLFWTMWYISLKTSVHTSPEMDTIPWPVWPMLGWGIGIIFHYLSAYTNSHKLAEKEYKKLQDKQVNP